MHSCLTKICVEFEKLEGFLHDKTASKEQLTHKLFIEFMECFQNIKAEKLEYPKEFIGDVRLYHEQFPPLLKKFEDIEIQYLMLSDFYDFARLTKKYEKV